MKLYRYHIIFAVLYLLPIVIFGQTNYYIDAVNGNDANNGTSSATAWKNISKLNVLTITPGSTINLAMGSVWNGQQLKFNGSGLAGSPIIVNSYGSGAKPLLNGNGIIGEAVVYLYNQQYIEINNLEITNDPLVPWADAHFFVGINNGTTNTNPNGADRRGVMVAIDGFGTATHIWLKNLDIHHVKGQLGSGQLSINGAIPKRTGGIYFSVLGNLENSSNKSRFDDVLIDGCNVFYCENIGISFDNEWNVFYPGGENSVNAFDRAEFADWYNRRFSNVKVSNNVIHHIGKNAIIIRCTDETGLIERNVCYETALGTTGNTIFTTRAKGTVLQYNEGYFNRATTQTIDPGNYDGSLYDPDYGSVGIIFQYSYSHDNSSGLYWGCNTRSLTTNTSGIPDPGDVGCTLRYCISQNDKGALVFFNYPSAGNEIYNNVFYIKAGISPNIIQENSSSNHTYNYFNNVVYNMSSATSGAGYSFAPTGQTRTISNNCFYYNHPASEPTDPFKSLNNPFFVSPGSGGNGINTLNGYKLQNYSPIIGQGRLIANNGGYDYFGNAVSSTIAPNIGAYQGTPIKATAPIAIFYDDFSGTNNTLITNPIPALPPSGYVSNLSQTAALPTASAKDTLNLLQFSNATNSATGLGYVMASDSNFLAPFNPILANTPDSIFWSFNMWTNRNGSGTISSAMNGAYGAATILACDNADPTVAGAKGYGIFMLQGYSATRFRFHLIHFTNGINGVANSGTTNQTIIDTSVSLLIDRTKFYSIKVSYDPQTNKWQLFHRDSTAFQDPGSNFSPYTSRPAIANTTSSTSIALKYFGFAYRYGSTTSINNAQFDNFKVTIIPQLQTLAASPSSLNFGTILSGTQSAAQSFNLSGSQLSGFPGNVTISAPSTDFLVSSDNITFGATATKTFTTAALASTPVYVKFTPQSAAVFSANVKAIGGGADTLYFPVTGTGVNPCIIGGPIYNTNTIFTFIAGQNVNIPFTVYGTINAGNIYTAQLSNASGSFTSPVNIGTLTSNATGALSITGLIPTNTTSGTGYLIRVIASNPSLTGIANTNSLTVIATQTLPYSQTFSSFPVAPLGSFTTYPSGWQAWKFNNNTIGTTAATDAPLIEKQIKVGDASIVSDSAYAYDFNGKIGFGTGSIQNGLVLAINTTGYTNIGLSFDAMTMWNPMTTLDSVVAGLQIQYRVGGTGAFTLIPSYSLVEYKNITTAQTSGTTGQNIIANLNVTLPPACDNQSIVEIRWVLHKVTTLSGAVIKTSSCPTFAIDNVYVGLSTQAITPTSFYSGDAVNIPFTAAGIFLAGNTYTAQLSDANGSFTTPVIIGSVVSSASGASTIAGVIPYGITGGSGYRIRVVSSNPAINGSDNGSNLSIVATQTLPFAENFSTLNGTSISFPAGWQGHLISSNPPSSGGRTADASSNKSIIGGTAADAANGIYDYNGKLGFLSTKSFDNAITLSFKTLSYSGGIGLSFDAMTIRNPYVGSPSLDSIIQGLVLQYRVGNTGIFTTIPYSASEYVTNTTQQLSGTTPQNRINGLYVTLPADCDNKQLVQLRWIARTVSGNTSSTSNSQRPSFAIDNVYLGISTKALGSNAYSTGDTIQVVFNAAGSFGVGNVFTVQLSNSTGSFATPTSIGSITSSASGLQTIIATIPAGQAVGSGYLIRVVSSNLYVIGTESGTTVTIGNAYYYKGSGRFDAASSWGQNKDGSGSAPPDFISNYQFFKIVNTSSVNTLTAGAFAVTGTNSRISLGDTSKPGVSLTVSSGFPISITGGGALDITRSSDGVTNKIYLQDSIAPSFGIMHNTSEVHFQANINSGTTKSFGNIFVENNSTLTLSSAPSVQTSFIIASGATLNTTRAGTFCKINMLTGSSVTINGTINIQNSAGLSCGICTSSSIGAVFNFTDALPNIILGTSSLVQYAKASNQTVQAFAYANLEISGSGIKTISATGGLLPDARVTKTLTVTGTAVLATSNLLTLKSTATGTACVAPNNTGTNYITGDVTVERYIPASRRAWRLLSTPTNSLTQTIRNAWQNDGISGSVSPGIGTWITTNNASWSTNGFDGYSSGNSLLKFNNNLNTWETVTTTNNPIATDDGYMVFVRGDRTATTISSTVTATTLSTKGPLKLGNYPATPYSIAADKFQVVGNPYPAAISLKNITKSGVDDAFYVWDSKRGTLGAWQYLTSNGAGSYIITPGTGSYGTNGSVMDSVQSGQAFIVRGSPSGGTVQFNENCKLTSSTNVLRPTIAPIQFATNIYSISLDGSSLLLDGVLTLYSNNYSNKVNEQDVKKLKNFGENLSMVSEQQLMAIEKKSLIGNSDTIFYNLSKFKTGNYQLEFNANNLNQPRLIGKIIDQYLKKDSIIILNGKTIYNFSINTDSLSFAPDRFKVVFSKISSPRADFDFVNVNYLINHAHEINWSVSAENNIQRYLIQASADGINFESIGWVEPAGTGKTSFKYSFLINNPLASNSYYKIQAIGISEYSNYSQVVKLSVPNSIDKEGVSVYPNPVIHEQCWVSFTNVDASGNCQIEIFDEAGKSILKKYVNSFKGNTKVMLPMPKEIFKPGIYVVKISDSKGKTQIKKFFVSN